jgi:hypothetical protein
MQHTTSEFWQPVLYEFSWPQDPALLTPRLARLKEASIRFCAIHDGRFLSLAIQN